MNFQSYEYLALLVLVVAIYWLLPRLGQNILLLAASYIFYAWVHPWLALLLLGYTVVAYAAARGIRDYPEHRRKILVTAITSALLVLGIFKYLGFFVDDVIGSFPGLDLTDDSFLLSIFLPIGISFYAFQTLSYVIDVYRGDVQPRNNIVDVAVFVSFFPQLVAGPIERAGRLLPQYENRRRISHDDFSGGLQLLLWGFFKKLVVADNVAIIVDKVFQTQSPSPALLVVGVLAFGLQIFADFSGYTDIARGSARLLGIRLSQNFDNPYLSASPMDFWRRWHISLSTWFRDYVYIPLGGSRTGPWRNVGALMATFLLAGLWHGAAWNFIVWGAYHGALLQVHRMVGVGISGWPRLGRVGSVILTFALINAGWFFFRADDLSIGWDSLTSSLDGSAVGSPRVTAFLFFQVLIYSVPIWAHAIFQHVRMADWPQRREVKWALGAPLRTGVALVLFTGILVIRNQVSQEFIYFQF